MRLIPLIIQLIKSFPFQEFDRSKGTKFFLWTSFKDRLLVCISFISAFFKKASHPKNQHKTNDKGKAK